MTLTIPTPRGRSRSRVRSASRHTGCVHLAATVAPAAPCRSALRLHRPRRHPARAATARSSATPRANFSMLQARALEACHRAEVEVVIKSGPPRGPGAGGLAADRPDRLHLRGRLRGRDRRRDHGPGRRLRAGRGEDDLRDDRRPRRSRAAVRGVRAARSSTTRPGTPSACTRISSGARSTSPRRTRCSSARATAPCG